MEREKKNSVFSDDITLYIDNLKNSIKKTVQINKFSEVAGYKIYTQKSVTFLYTNSEILEGEIKKTTPFKIA